LNKVVKELAVLFKTVKFTAKINSGRSPKKRVLTSGEEISE
jgi:hypothetical protein